MTSPVSAGSAARRHGFGFGLAQVVGLLAVGFGGRGAERAGRGVGGSFSK
jgi:hypothetical protein